MVCLKGQLETKMVEILEVIKKSVQSEKKTVKKVDNTYLPFCLEDLNATI